MLLKMKRETFKNSSEYLLVCKGVHEQRGLKKVTTERSVGMGGEERREGRKKEGGKGGGREGRTGGRGDGRRAEVGGKGGGKRREGRTKVGNPVTQRQNVSQCLVVHMPTSALKTKEMQTRTKGAKHNKRVK